MIKESYKYNYYIYKNLFLFNKYYMKLLIEIGTYDGSDSLRYYNNDYKVYAFEPNKDLYEKIFEKTKKIR